MRILLSNNHLHTIGGSETALYALAVEFKRLGHDVEYFTFTKGKTSQRLEAAGIEHVSNAGHYDIGILSHNSTAKRVLESPYYSFSTTVNVCHGTIPKLEQPAPGCDFYVGISEEVKQHIIKVAPAPGKGAIIRNGVDMERFTPSKPTGNAVLSLCQSQKANNILKAACHIAGKTLVAFNKFTNPVWKIESVMADVDTVVTLGRGAIEAMSMGKRVIVWDHRDYNGGAFGDGLLDDPLARTSMTCNYSGRAFRHEFDAAELAERMRKPVKSLRPIVAEFHDIRKTAQQYLALVK